MSAAVDRGGCVPEYTTEKSHAYADPERPTGGIVLSCAPEFRLTPVDSFMPTVFVTRTAHFNAAHRLHNPDKSDEWNRTVYGKCNSPNWHGHNYRLEVTVEGEPDPDTGYVIDLGVLKKIVEERVVEPCDHANLNKDVGFLSGVLPSSENLVVAFWSRLKDELPSGRLHSIRLYETENNVAEYRGD